MAVGTDDELLSTLRRGLGSLARPRRAQSVLLAQSEAEWEFYKQSWAGLPPEQREELGITDEMVETGELPPDWR